MPFIKKKFYIKEPIKAYLFLMRELGLDMAKIAALYEMTFVDLTTPDDLEKVLAQPVNGPRLIAYTSDRQANVVAHHRFIGEPDD